MTILVDLSSKTSQNLEIYDVFLNSHSQNVTDLVSVRRFARKNAENVIDLVSVRRFARKNAENVIDHVRAVPHSSLLANKKHRSRF